MYVCMYASLNCEIVVWINQSHKLRDEGINSDFTIHKLGCGIDIQAVFV